MSAVKLSVLTGLRGQLAGKHLVWCLALGSLSGFRAYDTVLIHGKPLLELPRA